MLVIFVVPAVVLVMPSITMPAVMAVSRLSGVTVLIMSALTVLIMSPVAVLIMATMSSMRGSGETHTAGRDRGSVRSIRVAAVLTRTVLVLSMWGRHTRRWKGGLFPLRLSCGLAHVEPFSVIRIVLSDPARGARRCAWRAGGRGRRSVAGRTRRGLAVGMLLAVRRLLSVLVMLAVMLVVRL